MKNQIMKNLVFSIIVLSVITSCSSDSTDNENQVIAINPTNLEVYFPPNNSNDWETISIADLEWDSNAEQPLFNFLEEKDTKAFIILKDGRIVIERYFNDHTQTSNWYWASAGKTLTAFTVGIAQQNNLLDINDKTSDYLGLEWTSLHAEKENLITISNQLSMTSGMNDFQFDCVTPDCLNYVADAGTRWAYHNGPYTLLQSVVASASSMEWSAYFNQELRDKIGMDGFWVPTNGSNNVFFSTARSMARFGLLNLSNGIWDDTSILNDAAYLNGMKNTSQDLNQSYGYLWWLNGKSSYRAPASQTEFDGELIPNAPSDMYAGLGKNDQKLYIVPSEGLVIIRLGETAGEEQLGPSSFDNELWGFLNDLMD
jgi:CubicO group peptidase (beta-lactamase class C family)